jgi:hypothetical protein
MICPQCNSSELKKAGKTVSTKKQRYKCKECSHITSAPLNNSGNVSEGYVIKGQSTLYDENGKVKLVWEKTDRNKEEVLKRISVAITELCNDIKPLKPTTFDAATSEDLMVIIPIGDAHIGMLSWGEETGNDYDLDIAESLHCSAIDQLIAAAPSASHCTILDVGDFIHADNMDGTTSRSGHSLDMDGRYHKIIRCCMRIVRYYIQAALAKFKHVTYRPEIGNHNDIGAIWLQEALANLYENEPRVTIANVPGVHYFFQHGLCYFGCHHGHTTKIDKLPDVLGTHLMNLGIKTKFRKWFTGHIHHQSKKDFNSCEVQSYRTLAGLDAYASTHGYNAPRDISLEVWHKEFGEVSTHRVSVPMLEIGGAA